ncbi:MAG: carboxypeptidase-like regulatory domain-containing protein [Planctomycetota bacterium]|nr:carboxypeptidase-like regulatory domain-containing protein [Planctomycetota bacterium]
MNAAHEHTNNRAVWSAICACAVVGLLVFVTLRLIAKPRVVVVEQTVQPPTAVQLPPNPVDSANRTNAPAVTLESADTPPAHAGTRYDDPSAMVRGEVTSRAMNVSNALVVIVIEGNGAEARVGETTTDAQGRFTFSSDGLGRALGTAAFLRIDATATGYLPGSARYGLISQSPTNSMRCDVRLSPGSLVDGRIVDANRRPVLNATVAFFVEKVTGSVTEFVPVSSTTVRFDGTFAVGFDSSGTYRITARAEGVGTALLEKLELESGQPLELDDLVLQGGAPIVGRAVTTSGDPVPFLDLWAIDTNYANEPDALSKATLRARADERGDGLALTKTATDAAGRFLLGGLRPGHYALRSPDRAVVIEPRQARYEPGASGVDLVVQSQRLVVRVLHWKQSDRGSVDPAGVRTAPPSSQVPMRTAIVRISDLSTLVDGTHQASNTRAQSVNSETGIATFTLDPEAPVAVQAFAGDRASAEEIVVLARNEWTREITLTLDEAGGKGSVRFDVLGEDALPLTQLVVEARSSATQIVRDDIGTLESDALGVVKDIPAGTYAFTIGFAPGTDRDHFHLRTSDPVVVRGGQETVVSLRARRGARVRVAVDLLGAPPSGYDTRAKLAPEEMRDRFGSRVTLTAVNAGAATALQFRPASGPGIVGAILSGETLVSDTLIERGEYQVTIDSAVFVLAQPLRALVVPGAVAELSVTVVTR